MNEFKLRKIRVNLRTILKLACLDELGRLSKKRSLYQKKRIRSGFLTNSQIKREKTLIQSYSELDQTYRNSILICSGGATCLSYEEEVRKGLIKPSERPIDVDMVWVPHYNAWFCLKCFEKYHKVKTCEQCCKLDEFSTNIVECYICNRYLCDHCGEDCHKCGETYCDQCYFDHLVKGECSLKDL